jgi:hypothetical protein
MGFRGTGYVSHPDTRESNAWEALDCGGCGRSVSAVVVARTSLTSGQEIRWLQCPTCGAGSVRNADGRVSPAIPFGHRLQGLPDDVERAFEEARRCMSVGGYVAAELVCRKILMHVAVEKGADEDKSFADYVSYLEAKGYVTPPMKGWVALIRTRGNEATHELTPVTMERAESTLMFTTELLRLTYEMESMAEKYAPEPAGEEPGQ